MLDYELLRFIWWLLLGVLFTGYAVTDGFDLGVAVLLPLVARDDIDRRVVVNTVGPVWEGNQVWLILGAGAIFAAWPAVYAMSFSGFYFAMMIILSALIIRPVAFKYRSKIDSLRWRFNWDRGLFFSGFVPSVLFGVAVGNVLQGVPFHFDDTLRGFYTGSFFGLLNPFALLCGVLSLSMFVMQGGFYLAVKTENNIRKRALRYANFAALLVVFLFAAAGFWVAFGIEGYIQTSPIVHDGASNPLHKTVMKEVGAWLRNYYQYPFMLLAPVMTFIGALFAITFSRVGAGKMAFVFSSASIVGVVSTVGLSMFPFILPSFSHPSQSLTVWDASSSQFTLFIMMIVAAFFIPVILLYTGWVYRVMRGKVRRADIEREQHTLY